MKKVSLVLCLGVLLILSSAALSAQQISNDLQERAQQAWQAMEDGRQLTPDQKEAIELVTEALVGDNELDRTGGPDGFGYYYFDSDEGNGPAYDWIDIIETGDALEIPGDDAYTGPFDIGFDFEFYGNTYDQFYLGSNGMIGFETDGMTNLGNHDLPNPATPNNIIAWYWDDMDPANGADGMAYIENFGDYTVIQFADWDEYPNGPDQNNVNAEIILYSNGDIVLQYLSYSPNIDQAGCTIGIEGPGGQDGIMYTYNNANDIPAEQSAVGFTINEGGFADPDANVEGIVSNTCNGEAVEGAEVYFGNLMATTDADGYYMIEGVYSRGYTARAMAQGFAMAEVDVVLEEGDNVVDIEMEPLAELSADPDQFTFDVGWLASDSDILTISHLGDCGADIDFWVDITYIEDEEIMDFRRMVRENAANFRATRGTTINYNGPSSDIFNVVPTEPQFSELDDPYFLLFQDQVPWNNSHQDYLNELGIPFDLVNSASMADYDFDTEEYNVIMIPSTQGQNFYNNFMNNIDRFEEWVDGGGCLEFHGCTQGATWTFWNDMAYVHQGDGNNQVVMPDHPMMEGIPENFTGTSANHGYIDNVPDDALVLCVDTQQRPVLIELGYGGGNIVLSTQTLEFAVPNGQVAGDIMHNMIEYDALWVGSGAWLTVEPDAGTVEPAGIMDLDVIADASGVDLPGIYEASIDVWYDDGTEEGAVVTSWVTMNVGDPGSLEGIVSDSDTGDPIEGALVTIWGDLEEPVAEVETDADGYYTYPLGTGDWDVMGNAMGYYPSDVETVALVEGEVTIHDIMLDHEIAPELVVDPEFFDFEAGWLGSDSDILTLSNIGGLPADWSGSITYIEDEIAAHGNNDQARRERVVQNWIERSGILDGPLTSYPLETTIGANGPDVVANPDQIARVINGNGELDDANVLLYPADTPGYPEDVAAKLAALELFETITIVDARFVVPTLEELMEYDAVMTWTNYQYLDRAGVGDVMADYVDEGYGVVTAVFESAGVYMLGRWNTEQYYAFPTSGNQYGPQQTLGEVFEANHLMMEEIEELDGGTSSYRQSTMEVHPEALRVADWGDGRAVAAVREELDAGVTVALGLFPPSNDVINGGWNPASNCDRLMANALLVASGGGGWLSIEPNSGHLEVDELVEIDVLANAVDVELPGVYEATIDFNVAWPDTLDDVTVWVTFLIGDPGTLQGVVYDSETEDPIVGAEVVIWGDLEEPIAELETDENGEYIYPLGTGDWTVWSNALGYYESDMLTANVVEGEVTQFDIALVHETPPVLTADPEQLLFEVGWLGNDADIVTLGNLDGGLPADWDSDITYIEEDEVNRMRRNAREYLNTRIVEGVTPDFNLPSTTDINAYPNIPTAPYANELDDPYFLIIQDNDAWGAPAHQAFLDEMEVPFDMINSGQMADHDLDEYTCIIFTNVQSQNFLNTVQDNEERFLDFMDDGGWIIFGGCTQRYNWNLWGMSNTYAPSGTGFNNMPEHEIMMDIPEQWTGGSDSHDIINDVPEDANILATTSLGEPTLVEVEMGRGTILISTMTWEIGWNIGWVNADILGNTIAYAVLYAGSAGWLTVEPGDGWLEIGDETDLDVMANAIDVELPGVYEATIDFNVSYPDTLDPATVWVTLMVGDPGSLEGIVSDSDTGDPLEGALVTIWAENGEEPVAEVETDADGYYTYPLGTGNWDVMADAFGYYPSDIVVADLIEGEVTVLDFELDHEIPPELIVDPEFFDFEINWGEQDSDILTLGNIGGLPADWYSDIVYIEDEEIATANHAGLLERRARNLQNVQLVQPADITGSTPGLMGMQDQDQQWEPELDEGPYLVLHTTDIAQSLQRALNELEVEEVTYMNTQAWNGIDFEGYNTVMVAMDGGTPTVADWNWVFDWCRAGGTLMLFGGTNWADAYNAMNDFCHHSGQQGWAQSAPPHINFEDGHPLNENLEDGTTFANNGASYYMFRFDDEEMDVASTNGDGWPNIFAKDVDNGTFVCFTSSAASVWWANQQDYEVYVQIVENCLNYAGGSGWLTIDPEDGYLEIDDVTDIDVLVDAVPDSLFGGVYEAMINFNVDWPDTLDPVTVWVTLNVNGGPPRHQWVTLQPNYFELISMNLNPERFNADAEEMFGPLVDLDIVYQNDGSVFIPPDINGIGNVDFHQAYRVHTGAEGVVHVLGDLIDVDEEYSLEAGSWKWLGYPFAHEVSASTALGEIEDDLIIVMNDQGHLWIPGLINTMGNMIPGEGYMTFVDDDVTFTFGGGGDVLASTSDEDIMPTPVVEDAPVATGLPYAVLVSFSDEVMSLEPAVVEIYDGNIMVGKGVVQEDYDVTPVITWQGSTGHALQGFKPGNPMSVVIRNASGAKLPVAIEETPKFGEGAYATLSLENSALPTEFAVKQGYPNPFNPSVTVPFALPRSGQVEFSVFNILGQEVFKSSTNFQAGYHRFLFDASRDGNELVSGVYFLQVNYNGQVKTQKLMLLK